eukprot:1139044-Pelagomonas_calceolata.AAC.11
MSTAACSPQERSFGLGPMHDVANGVEQAGVVGCNGASDRGGQRDCEAGMQSQTTELETMEQVTEQDRGSMGLGRMELETIEQVTEEDRGSVGQAWNLRQLSFYAPALLHFNKNCQSRLVPRSEGRLAPRNVGKHMPVNKKTCAKNDRCLVPKNGSQLILVKPSGLKLRDRKHKCCSLQ